jgi:hypothetical protein
MNIGIKQMFYKIISSYFLFKQWKYLCSFFSGNEHQEPDLILETPGSNKKINRSGNEKLYTLEEQDKRRAKEEKRAKKKKDKKDKVPF